MNPCATEALRAPHYYFIVQETLSNLLVTWHKSFCYPIRPGERCTYTWNSFGNGIVPGGNRVTQQLLRFNDNDGEENRRTKVSRGRKVRAKADEERRGILTLGERMPPYSRRHKYSKKIECRRTGGKKKKKFPTLAGIKIQKLSFS